MRAKLILGRRVTVEAPATIANLGAGYDTLGLAVDLTLRVTIEAREPDPRRSPVELRVTGEGADELRANRTNRLVVALEAGLRAMGVGDPEQAHWTIDMVNPIPLERGLGSSAAATVAGVLAAVGLTGRMTNERTVIDIATEIEGHPDNVTPAIAGGLTASLMGSLSVEYAALEPPTGVEIVAWVPERRLATSDMRRVLPDVVPRADAIANLARVALGMAWLATGRPGGLSILADDRLHEPYRAVAYPELPALLAAARGAGATGACLAGSGSTVVAYTGGEATASEIGEAVAETSQHLGLPGRILVLRPQPIGAHFVETN